MRSGEMRTIAKGATPVVVIRTEEGEYYAVRGICPHQGASLAKGRLWPLTSSEGPGTYELSRGAEILRCPWHAFEYDVTTGRCVGDPSLRVRTYPVYIEDGQVVVDLGSGGGQT